jgi:GNAT superfamily N-acetyltransferase
MTAPNLLESSEQEELYLRGSDTLLASWQAYACRAAGAALHRLPGVAAAVFPNEPERAVYNNALLERDLRAGDRADALDVMEAAYAAAGISRFAAWVHETDPAMRAELERRGYTLDMTTRSMGMTLDDIRVPRPKIPLGPAGWAEYLRMEDLPPDFLKNADHAAFHLLAARIDGEMVAAALAYDFGDDCGIYNVGTVQKARRRGLATALTGAQVHDARARGCRTASLQSTQMAERVYAAVGFRDLGRILEYVPRKGTSDE